jgi:hypothetical protein
MAKWERLITNHGIALGTQEKRLISRLRNERNKIIHGKNVGKFSIEDLEKFRSILERVFVAKATELIDSNYGIPDLSRILG